TPKCYVGGAFIRSESGRVRACHAAQGDFIANIPLCSRKDLRNAVEAAAKAGASWATRTPYNRGQILYRVAEMLEARASEMASHIAMTMPPGTDSQKLAQNEVKASINRVVHFAGWADKFEQVLGSVNPVSSRHFNFTITEPTGVIGIIAPHRAPLLALMSLILPAIVSGNSVVALASATSPYPAIILGEILACSDLPGGVINLLTGDPDELATVFAAHQQIRAMAVSLTHASFTSLEKLAAESVKRIVYHETDTDWFSDRHDSPYTIRLMTEAKTVWHPIGA
ncbi:MAG: aldehyde dehydrogenase family protein, partial [Luteolibacter sp.]